MIQPDLITLAHMETRQGAPFLRGVEKVAIGSNKDVAPALAKLVKDLKLEGTQCIVVLNPKDYSLQLIEAPNVEPDELRSAVRWKIKDLLDMKLEDAAIDVFRVPEDAYRGKEMV